MIAEPETAPPDESDTASLAPGDWRPASVDGSLDTSSSTPDTDTELGSTAPTVVGYDFMGQRVTIEDNGKPKLIVFLAHWCPHCQREVAGGTGVCGSFRHPAGR